MKISQISLKKHSISAYLYRKMNLYRLGFYFAVTETFFGAFQLQVFFHVSADVFIVHPGTLPFSIVDLMYDSSLSDNPVFDFLKNKTGSENAEKVYEYRLKR